MEGGEDAVQVLEALVAPTVMAVLFVVLIVTMLRGLNPLRQQAGRAKADQPAAGRAQRTDRETVDGAGAERAERTAEASSEGDGQP